MSTTRWMVLYMVLLCLLFIVILRLSNEEPPAFACGVALTDVNPYSLDPTNKFVFNDLYKWHNKKVLKVYFREEVDEALIKKTLRQANEWSNYTDITFVPTSSSSDSQIRVAFWEGNGYFSLIGNLADSPEYAGGTTMWLQDLDKCSDREFNRVVLHEFGHALGLYHELQNSKSLIQWDTAKIYPYFLSVYGWDSAKVQQNILSRVETTRESVFDPNSIMIYAIPAMLMKNHMAISLPSGLSNYDKSNIRTVYP